MLKELGARQASAHLANRVFGLVFDEADHISGQGRIMETLRDLSDVIELPIVLVGMGKIRDNLTRFPQIASRVSHYVRFGYLMPTNDLFPTPRSWIKRQGPATDHLLSEGQMSDYRGARLVPAALPQAEHLIAYRGYDSAWFRHDLQARGIKPCIPSSRSRKVPYAYDTALYRQRHKVDNLFAKLKGWRRIATRYDRCATPSSPPSASQLPVFSGSDQ